MFTRLFANRIISDSCTGYFVLILRSLCPRFAVLVSHFGCHINCCLLQSEFRIVSLNCKGSHSRQGNSQFLLSPYITFLRSTILYYLSRINRDLNKRQSGKKKMQHLLLHGSTVCDGCEREIEGVDFEEAVAALLEMRTTRPIMLTAFVEKLSHINPQRWVGIILSKRSTDQTGPAGTPGGLILSTAVVGVHRIVSIDCAGTFQEDATNKSKLNISTLPLLLSKIVL